MTDVTADPFAVPDVKPASVADAPKAPDVKPSRPTTRAGRAAAAQARQARKAANPDAAPAKAGKSKPTPRKAELETRIAGQIAFIGTCTLGAGGAMGNPAVMQDGAIVLEHSANIAAALKNLADSNPKVKAALESMVTASAWGGVLAALLPVVVGIGANHGVIPQDMYAQIVGAMTALAVADQTVEAA